jgi:hypothetical protein
VRTKSTAGMSETATALIACCPCSSSAASPAATRGTPSPRGRGRGRESGALATDLGISTRVRERRSPGPTSSGPGRSLPRRRSIAISPCGLYRPRRPGPDWANPRRRARGRAFPGGRRRARRVPRRAYRRGRWPIGTEPGGRGIGIDCPGGKDPPYTPAVTGDSGKRSGAVFVWWWLGGFVCAGALAGGVLAAVFVNAGSSDHSGLFSSVRSWASGQGSASLRCFC